LPITKHKIIHNCTTYTHIFLQITLILMKSRNDLTCKVSFDKCSMSARVARFLLIQYTKTGENLQNQQIAINYTPNGRKIFKTTIKYTPSNIFPIWYFWYENVSSGNPGVSRRWIRFQRVSSKWFLHFLIVFPLCIGTE
jgi:hypothetical protein